MQKLLTIVIPTYNMQAYLNRCLDSLVVSDSLIDLIEILVINDGSRDDSSAIAHKYEESYPQSFRVIDKENGNYGSCINRGLAEAKGKYIKVLDADDWFDTKEFEKYLRCLNSIDADMVLTSFNIVNSSSNVASLAYSPRLENKRVYNFQQLGYEDIGVWMMHAVTYRMQMLKDIEYRQTEGISYTDIEWTYIPLYAVKSVVYLDCIVYQYLVGRDGQTMDSAVLIKSVWQHEHLARRIIKHVENLPEEDKKGFSYVTTERQISYLVNLVYRTCLIKQDSVQFDNNKLMSFDQFLLSHRPDLYISLGKEKVKPFFPLRYVGYWRRHGKRFPIDGLRKAFRKLRYDSN